MSDNAFGCFLGGLVGADGPFVPVERKPADRKSTRWWRWSAKDKCHAVRWPKHGMVSGPKGRAAWAVKDAQYFGLAQRRERVLVVADFGIGADPAAVLFERVSVPWNPPARGEAGKGSTHATAPSLTASGRGVERTGESRGQDPVVAILRGHSDYGDGLPSIRAKGGDCAGGSEALVFAPEIARCVATREGSSQDYETTTMVAVEVAPTVRAGGNSTGGDRPYGMDVDTCDSLAVVHAIQAGALRTNPNSGPDGVGVQEGLAYTIEARSEVQAVAYRVAGDGAVYREGDRTAPLTTGTDPSASIVAFAQNSRDEVRLQGGDGQIVGALAAEPGMKQQTFLAQTVALRGREGGATAELGGEVATALRASSGGGDKPHVLTSAVRRLTPRECERLQGFQWLCSPTDKGAWQDEAGRWWSPDYTRIPVKQYAKPKYTKNRPPDMWEQIDGKWWLMAADGPRYKQLGNSWAVPKFRWLGERIQRLMPPREAANDNQDRSNAA